LPNGPLKLELKKLETGEIVTMDNAPATHENRESLMWGGQPDFSKSTATLFSSMNWKSEPVQVQVDGHDTWYMLVDVDGQSASRIFDFARANYGDQWQREIEQNSVSVLNAMGLQFVAGVAWLDVRTMDTKQTVRILKRIHEESPQVRIIPKPQEHYSRLSPFSAVRWTDTDYQVQIGKTWFGLVAIDDQPLSQVIAFAEKQYGDDMVQKRIDEDLVEALTTMGHKPGTAVKLQLRKLDTGELVTLDKVRMTEENRSSIFNDRHNPSAMPTAPTPPGGTSGL